MFISYIKFSSFQLLNERSDEDDSSNKQHSELLKRLQTSTRDDHREMMTNNPEMDNEALKLRLRFQGGPENNRKRASDESDDSSSGTSKRPTKLQERNKMLASLLAGPSRPLNTTTLLSTVPSVRMMPDIPNQVKSRHDSNGLPSPLTDSQPATPNQQTTNNNKTINNNTVTKNNNIKIQKNRPVLAPLRQAGIKQVADNIYLSQLHNPQGQQQHIAVGRALGNLLATSQTINPTSQGSFDGGSGHPFVSSSPAITSAPASSSSIQLQPEYDPELNDILEKFIEFDEGNFEHPMNFSQLLNSVTNSSHLMQQEELAEINKIQQSLMECEEEGNFTGSPPAYPLHGIVQARIAQQQGFSQQPPPGYNQRNVRLPQMNVTSNNNIVTNSNTTTVAQASNSQQSKQQPTAAMLQRLQMQQHQQRLLQMQQKERLLQQQQNQQILVTAGADQLCMTIHDF